MFRKKLRLSFYDCDPAGIIFYASIFKLAHSVYEQFLSEIVPERNFFFDKEYVLPIIHSEADYLKPLRPFDEVEIELKVVDLRDSSFELNYIFFIDNVSYAEVKTVHVCVRKENFNKEKLPEALTKGLGRHLS